MLYPLTFRPIRQDRVWGSELWTVSDRPGDESVIANGPLAGRTLCHLMQEQRYELMGEALPAVNGRFPLLCKIIEARDTLSVQVHPPSGRALELGGEPKTEMWYVTAAAPGAELYVGLRRGVTRDDFERALEQGEVAGTLHRVPVSPGDVMFLPSGRVHAIGAGLTLLEIQQNSDTTYRVFDWNRVGLDGKPRTLHVRESLASIDFADSEPALEARGVMADGAFDLRPLVRHPLFDVDAHRATAAATTAFGEPLLRVIVGVEKRVTIDGAGVAVTLGAGEFCVLPASVANVVLAADAGSVFLVVTAG